MNHHHDEPAQDPVAFWEARYGERDQIWTGKVNKALADFSQRGWVRIEQRSVTLLDVDRLDRRAR